MPKEHDLNVALLEDRTSTGWSGVAEITCPHCGLKHVVKVITLSDGRAVGFWEAEGEFTVHRAEVKRN